MLLRFLLPVVLAATALVFNPADAVELPTDFVNTTVATGLVGPVNFDFLPDGRVILVEQFTGNLRLYSSTTGLLPDPIGRVGDLRTGVFDGLLGVAVDPLWPQKPYVYTHSVGASTPNIRILRHAFVGDLDGTGDGVLVLDSLLERTILADLPSDGGLHRGGSIEFGPDNFLYVALGDDGYGCSAQDVEQLRGKILRLNVRAVPDEPGPAPPYWALAAWGNPYVNHPNPRARLVLHYGLRNPWHIDFNPITGALAIADVGFEDWEEIDLPQAVGRNFGWPLFEGPELYEPGCDDDDLSTLTAPSFACAHDTLAQAVTIGLGGVCYAPPGPTQKFPHDYWGQLFYYDFFDGRLNRVDCVDGTCTPADTVAGQPDSTAWGTGFQFTTRMRFGPDGALWYLQGDQLARIAYNGAVDVDPAPVASATLALAAYPNPSPGRVAFELRLPEAAATSRLDVFDVAGRRVRRLPLSGPLAAGPHRLTWDGRDDRGQDLPAGVYFAALAVDGATATTRVLRIRG